MTEVTGEDAVTTDELIKQVLEHDAKATAGPWFVDWQKDMWEADTVLGEFATSVSSSDTQIVSSNYEIRETDDDASLIAAYRTAAPLLARKLQRAMEVLEGIYDGTYDDGDAHVFLDEIEAME